ncbi:MAG: hypothetical protein WA170_02920, partial [Candidatus Acidiferrales bacterium]
PTDILVFMTSEFRNPKAAGKIRNYLQKWRPMRLNLPAAELESLGVPHGSKFDKILEQFFDLQLRGRGKTPPEVAKLLKQLAGIKDEPKPKEEKKKKRGKALETAGANRAAKRDSEAAKESAGVTIAAEPAATKTVAHTGKAAPQKHARSQAAHKASGKASAQRKKSARR